jgi:hypothetical protein
MMIKKIVILMHLVFLIGLLGCKKKVMDVNKDFLGSWYNDTKFSDPYANVYKNIEIKENSSATYRDEGGFSNKTFTGKAKIKGSVLKIGLKKFTIDEAPKRLGNVGNFWRMKISGVTYYIDKDYLFGGSYTCSPSKLSIWNTGSTTIHANMDGQNYNIPPNGFLESDITCFECESVYSDDHGNNFSFFHTGCANTIQVQ